MFTINRHHNPSRDIVHDCVTCYLGHLGYLKLYIFTQRSVFSFHIENSFSASISVSETFLWQRRNISPTKVACGISRASAVVQRVDFRPRSCISILAAFAETRCKLVRQSHTEHSSSATVVTQVLTPAQLRILY